MQLVRGLVTPQIQRRMQLPTLQKYLKIKAQCYLGRNTALENTEDAEDPQDVAQDPQDVAQDPQDVAPRIPRMSPRITRKSRTSLERMLATR